MVELIVVIVILGVLAALTVPAFTSVINKSKEEVAVQEASSVAREAKAIAAFDGGRTTLTATDFQQDMDKSQTGAQSASGSAPWTYTAASGISVGIDASGNALLSTNSSNPSSVVYQSGLDYNPVLAVYAGGSGSYAGHTDVFDQIVTSTRLWNEFTPRAGQSINLILTDGVKSASWSGTIVFPYTSLSDFGVNPDFSSVFTPSNNWESNWPDLRYFPSSITWNSSTSTLTFNV